MPRAAEKVRPSLMKSLLTGLLFSVLLGGTVLGGTLLREHLLDPHTLPLRVIQVQGELRHLDRQAMQTVVAEAINGGFFAVDIQRIYDRVRELPWVDRVSVRRVWPDTLVMHVSEQLPLARWGDSGLVNVRGEVFQPEQILQQGLVTLYGPEGSSQRVVAFYREVGEQLAAHDLQISRMGLDERREWSLELANGLRIVVGNEAAEARFDRFMRIYPLLASSGRKPQRIDLRYENGFAVYEKTPETAGAEQRGDA